MFDIFKILQFFIEDIDNQIRKGDFPDMVDYLNKIITVKKSDLPKVQLSFFEGIRLTYKAIKFQRTNNFAFYISLIVFLIYAPLNNIKGTYNLMLFGIPFDNILLIVCALSLLVSVVFGFLFVPLKNTIFKLFGEINLYTSSQKSATSSISPKRKTNGK